MELKTRVCVSCTWPISWSCRSSVLRFRTRRASLRHLEIDKRCEYMPREAATENSGTGDPDESRHHGIGGNFEAWHVEAIAVCIVDAVGVVVLGEDHAVRSGRRHRTGCEVLGAVGVVAAAAFGRPGGRNQGRQQDGRQRGCQDVRRRVLIRCLQVVVSWTRAITGPRMKLGTEGVSRRVYEPAVACVQPGGSSWFVMKSSGRAGPQT